MFILVLIGAILALSFHFFLFVWSNFWVENVHNCLPGIRCIGATFYWRRVKQNLKDNK